MSIPRESKEWCPFSVKLNGVPIFVDVEVAVLRVDVRPTELMWLADPPELVDGSLVIMTGTYAVGDWYIWARVKSNPEETVVLCGKFNVD